MTYSPSFEKASRKYRPAPVKVLFIAEAPPAYRFERFFYFEQVREADTLFLEMMKVLYPVDTGFVPSRKSEFLAKTVRQRKVEFLEKFKQDGFYLIDASEEPMPEDADTTAKKRIIHNALPGLRRKVRKLCRGGEVLVVLIGGPAYSVCADVLRPDGLRVLNEEMINHPARGGQELFRLKLGNVLRRSDMRTSDGIV